MYLLELKKLAKASNIRIKNIKNIFDDILISEYDEEEEDNMEKYNESSSNNNKNNTTVHDCNNESSEGDDKDDEKVIQPIFKKMKKKVIYEDSSSVESSSSDENNKEENIQNDTITIVSLHDLENADPDSDIISLNIKKEEVKLRQEELREALETNDFTWQMKAYSELGDELDYIGNYKVAAMCYNFYFNLSKDVKPTNKYRCIMLFISISHVHAV